MTELTGKSIRQGLCVILLTVISLWAGVPAGAQDDMAAWHMAGLQWKCSPTPADELGPFYKPGAPRRRQVGTGYSLIGIVVSAVTCEPIPYARIELWMAGPDGKYSDAYRATIKTGKSAAYEFKSYFPTGYSGRPPHIHMKISAEGFKTLVTQYYQEDGQTEGVFDLVLVPVR